MLGTLSNQLGSTGGPVLIALGVLSILGLTVSLFKFFQFMQLGVGQAKEAERIIERLAKRDRRGAVALGREAKTLRGQVMAAVVNGLTAQPGHDGLARELGHQAETSATEQLVRHMRLLETIVQAAPMLGLLGTVLGMIDVFEGLAANGGAADPSHLAEGIWTALITTAAGLIVAIPFYFVASLLESRVEQEQSAFDVGISQVLCSRTQRFDAGAVAADRAIADGRTQVDGFPGPATLTEA